MKARCQRCAPAAATIRFQARSSRLARAVDPPHRVAKLSGIGCSSKTPTYFLGASHGQQRARPECRPCSRGKPRQPRPHLYRRVGRWRYGLYRFGQFAHCIRRGVNMTSIVENNGVYGLTKGQFSATADKGASSKRGTRIRCRYRPCWACYHARRHLRGTQLLGRQDAARAAHQSRDSASRSGVPT